MRQVAQRDLHDVGRDGCARLCRIEGQVGLHAGGHGENHGFADRARDAEDVGRGDARGRRRGHHPQRRLQPRRTHGIGALAQRHRHRAHRVFRERSDVGNDHHAHHQAGRKQVEARQVGIDLLQDRRQEGQGEVAIDDGRHAAQQLEEGLGDFPDLEAGELRKVQRDDGAQRNRHHQGHGGTGQGAREQHHDAVMGIIEQRRPLRIEQEIRQGHMLEEAPGLLDQHIDDGKRDEDGKGRRGEQRGLDDALLDVARGLLAQAIADALADGRGECWRRCACAHGWDPEMLNMGF